MKWEPDPDLGTPEDGVSLERRHYGAESYDYRVQLDSETMAESRDGRESIGIAYWAVRRAVWKLRPRAEAPSAEELLAAAVKLVESASIRDWVQTDHNRPLWLKIAEKYLGKNDAEHLLCADIVGTAIGLF